MGDDALSAFLMVMRCFCRNERDLMEWAHLNKREIGLKLTEEQQERLRQEFKTWRELIRFDEKTQKGKA